MSALLQFQMVAGTKTGVLNFSVAAGEIRVLHAATPEAKTEIIDLALADIAPVTGNIVLNSVALEATAPGSIGWIPAHGGLISNLKTWENITLPLWYHNKPQTHATEEVVMRWLRELDIDNQIWEGFMASPAGRLTLDEQKITGLLRGLVLQPRLLVVDACLFDDVDSSRAAIWIKVLEKFAAEAEGCAVLVVASAVTALPWNRIG